MLKKIFSIMLSLTILCCLCSCGSKSDTEEENLENPVILQNDINSIEYTDSNTILRFSKTSEKWIWTDEPTFPLDTSYIDSLLAKATEIQTLTGTPIGEDDDLGEFGLDQPSFTFTFSDGIQSRTYYFGAYCNTDISYYMCDEDHTTLYEADALLVDDVPTNVQEMAVITSIPEIDASNVISIDFIHYEEVEEESEEEDNGETTVSVFYNDDKWVSFGKDVTDDMSAVLSEITDFTFSACVDYIPAEGAEEICGLTDDPTFIANITYENSVGVKSHLILTFGNYLESSDSYYVQMNNAGSIYTVLSSSIAKMMNVALKGF